MKTALVVVDVQSYFMKRAPADLPVRIAEHIRSSQYDVVCFTIFENQDGSNWERSLLWSECKDDADLVLAPELQEIADKANVYIKHSYSALKQPDIAKLLREQGIEKLEVCGIDTEACVLATSYDAFDQGYEVEVLFELSHSRAGLHEAAKSIILRDIQTKHEPKTH